MKRKIIAIDQTRCNGCGLCIPNCPEGAIQIIDGKARLISDMFCDGLGACLGHCPEGAITVEEREAEPYDEKKVMKTIIPQGQNVIRAHLRHLSEHNEVDYLNDALSVLKEKNIEIEDEFSSRGKQYFNHQTGCPGSGPMAISSKWKETAGDSPSALTHWPIQLHLISPVSPFFQGSDMVIAADCVAYSMGNFHGKFLKGKTLAIGCPKLDEGQDIYVSKITALIDQAKINTLTVMIMEVPCCGGLLRLVQEGAKSASRKVPIRCVVVGRDGKILRDTWLGTS